MFWSRIHDYFETHKKTIASRTESSIMHRWMIILFQVNKFCSCYESIERRQQSGATIQDKVSQASYVFKGLDKDNKSFTLLHCWYKLKGEEKWKGKRKEMEEQRKSQNKKQKGQPQSNKRQEAEPQENEDVEETTGLQFEGRKRPQGQKKAKEAIKRGGGEACMEALDKMWDKKEAFDMEKERKKEERFMASLEIEKRRLVLEKKNTKANLIEKEDKVMSMDITSLSLSPLQRQYYQVMQEKILARRLSNEN